MTKAPQETNCEVVSVAAASSESTVGCNTLPVRYWERHGFDDRSVLGVASELNNEWMLAVVTLHGDGTSAFTLSQKTWQRQEGHYPTVTQFLSALASADALRGVRGSFIVWLEDGMWDWCQSYARRAPIFAFGRNIADRHTLLMPDPAFIGAGGYLEERAQSEALRSRFDWQERRPTIFWRGAATGIGIEGPEWRLTSRARLALAAKHLNSPEVIDAKITRIKHLPQCAKEEIEREGLLDNEVPFDTFFSYRYVVDVDGYHCAWKSLFLKLLSGSLVLKVQSPFEQWYHSKLYPFEHYVPLSTDLSELNEVYDWLVEHDETAQKIAKQGLERVQSITLESSINELLSSLRAVLGCWRTS